MKTNDKERLHYEMTDLMKMTDEALVNYILYTMQRKNLTEYNIGCVVGYFGKTYDTPKGWHLLFWPFLGSYRHSYDWTRVFIKDGQLLFELTEQISKSQYDFEDIFLIEKIFPAPEGKTVGERYYPQTITHYTVDEFFDMLPKLPIKNFQPWTKHRYLVEVASSVQYMNPQRWKADAARRPKLDFETVAKSLEKAPELKVKPMSQIVEEWEKSL